MASEGKKRGDAAPIEWTRTQIVCFAQEQFLPQLKSGVYAA